MDLLDTSAFLPFAESAKGRCRRHTATEGSWAAMLVAHDPSARSAGTSPACAGEEV